MAINFDKALGIHEKALFLREQRNELLAANIANADTPGYQARDIDFRAALSEAGTQNQLAMTATQGGHFGDSSAEPYSADIKYRIPFQRSLDGNTVETHVEQLKYADNSMRYQTTLTFLSNRFASMKNIIQGGR
jgi:flagellar basal-body rod protein FlgB